MSAGLEPVDANSLSGPGGIADTVENRLDYWFDRLESHLDGVDAEVELEADRDSYGTRPLASDDYVLRTPGQTYILEEDSARGPHAKGNPDEGYTGDDEFLERIIAREVDRIYEKL